VVRRHGLRGALGIIREVRAVLRLISPCTVGIKRALRLKGSWCASQIDAKPIAMRRAPDSPRSTPSPITQSDQHVDCQKSSIHEHGAGEGIDDLDSRAHEEPPLCEHDPIATRLA
jgi:hypothetical protein